MKISTLAPRERASFVRISEAGAEGAGRALAAFLGEPDADVEPRPAVEDGRTGLVRAVGTDEGVAVGFELSGEATGFLLLLASADVGRRIAARLLKRSPADVDLGQPRVEGALAEVGNIVASAFLNAISMRVGAPCLPSVPHLAVGKADDVVTRALTQVGAARHDGGVMLVEIRLVTEPPLVVTLAFLPTPESLADMARKAGGARAEA